MFIANVKYSAHFTIVLNNFRPSLKFQVQRSVCTVVQLTKRKDPHIRTNFAFVLNWHLLQPVYFHQDFDARAFFFAFTFASIENVQIQFSDRFAWYCAKKTSLISFSQASENHQNHVEIPCLYRSYSSVLYFWFIANSRSVVQTRIRIHSFLT